jgi:hypothetical protein
VPERLDTITVQMAHGLLPLPWDSRESLLAELHRDEQLRPTVVAFEAVGATRPVEIPESQRQRLLAALDAWTGELPEGLPALRDACG